MVGHDEARGFAPEVGAHECHRGGAPSTAPINTAAASARHERRSPSSSRRPCDPLPQPIHGTSVARNGVKQPPQRTAGFVARMQARIGRKALLEGGGGGWIESPSTYACKQAVVVIERQFAHDMFLSAAINMARARESRDITVPIGSWVISRCRDN